jgi:hypothetical protein
MFTFLPKMVIFTGAYLCPSFVSAKTNEFFAGKNFCGAAGFQYFSLLNFLVLLMFQRV